MSNPSVPRPPVEEASALIKQVRADPHAEWPPGTLERADALLDSALGVEAPPVQKPPVPAGYQAFSRQVYSASSPRGWGNLGFPTSGPGTGRVGFVMIHGGGWMQGDPNVALPSPQDSDEVRVDRTAYWADRGFNWQGPMMASQVTANEAAGGTQYGLRVMANYLNQMGLVTWEPAYDYSVGNPDRCLAGIKRAIAWFMAHSLDFGINKLVVAGHSAGGHLAMRYTLGKDTILPHACIALAGAGLYVTPQTTDFVYNPQMGSVERIFQAAWGARQGWANYSPHSYVSSRPSEHRCPILLEIGNVNGVDDTQIPISWGRMFADTARNAGWAVTMNIQSGKDHFSVARWDQNPTTLNDMRALLTRI